MKKILVLFLVSFMACIWTFAFSETSKNTQARIILLIAEQNITGPQHAWWASEIDLSATEAAIAKSLIEAGYDVPEPSDISQSITKNRAFRIVDLSKNRAVKLGNLSRADFVISGKAVASAGGTLPDSQMRSCYANITAKLIRVKNGRVVAYLDAAGSSVHTDTVTGGKEALVFAASDLAGKIIEALKKEGGR